jgi:hypothetical protein
MGTKIPPLSANLELIDDAKTRTITRAFRFWLLDAVGRVESSAQTLNTEVATAESAAIALTTLVASASEVLYRVSWRFRVTTPASTSSSLSLTLTTTSGGVVCAQSSASYTGNATNRPQSGVMILKPDAAAIIQYSTTYGSVGATAMVYELDLVVEQL